MSRNQSSTRSSVLNQKAFLASAYQELGKELSSTKLKSIGSYTLGRPIGEGTYGKVRLATHRLTGLKVAIKQIPKTSSALGQLTREIHHHRRLHHPNIIQLYEVIATETNIWMCSELCPGGELYDYLVENGNIEEAESRRIFGQLCLALAYCHEKGIVHRDLKLENVLLDEKCNVKLGDFGFTREFERDKLMDTFCGTTGYAAPEMLRGERYRGEEVDIWSLGIILYALLFGTLPFDDDDEDVMKQQIWKGEFEMPPDGDGIKVGEEVRELITQILQLSPTKRPSIKQILSNPWFSKIFRDPLMSTVEEDGSPRLNRDEDDDGIVEEASSDEGGGEGNADTTTRPPATEEINGEASADQAKLRNVAGETPATSTLSKETSTISPSESSSSSSSKSAHSVSSDAQKIHHQNHVSSPSLGVSTISTDSRTSFYSAISDSGSSSASASDIRSGQSGKSHRSGRSDDTNPTTDDGDGSAEMEGSPSPKHSIEARTKDIATPVRPEQSIGISQKNESQTTIRREDSTGTIGDRNNSSSKNSNTNPLPTHHESPGSPEAEDEPTATSTTLQLPTPSSEFETDQSISQPSNSIPNSSGAADESQRASTSSPTAFASIALTKRPSQSSSKGHHRTPSRTKRRSLSSGALSDHSPPSLASRPIDYVSLMTQLQPAIFSTTLEQNLLHQLSSLGMDVGQIVHSIVNDACDVSGAMWWLLKRKAEEREAYGGEAAGTSDSITDPLAVQGASQVEAPPVPPKDPNRRSSKEELNPASTSRQSQSARDGLPKGAQDSFRRRLDASTIQALARIPSRGESASRTSGEDSKAFRHSSSSSEVPAEDDKASSAAAKPSSTMTASTSGGPSTSSLDHLSISTRGETSSPDSSAASQKTSSKAKAGTSKLSVSEMPTKPKRSRTNSFSMRQLTGKLGGGGGSSVPTVKVGEEELPMERAKSPVSNLFGKRNTQNALISKSQSPSSLDHKGEDKREERKLIPSKVSAALMAERLSSPHLSSGSSSPSSKAKARSPRGSEKDFERLKAMASMGTSSENASPTRIGSKAASRLGTSPSPAEIQAALQLTQSDSVETFSTLDSSEDHGKEALGSSNTLRKSTRTRSSFLSTVRTWLGSEDKQSRKQRKGMSASGSGSKLATKGLSPGPGHPGPNQSMARTGSVRARASPYQTTSPSSLSRRSTAASGSGPKSPQRGSLGRRGSTGSAHLIALLDGKIASPTTRPPNYRRQSAGSITPTATMYGDVKWEFGGSLSGSALRGSRPSSAHSMRRGPTSGSLHAKTGSASSSGSLMRLQQQASMGHHHHHLSSQASGEYAGSLRGLHGRRPSDGSTTVRRHRPYTAAAYSGNSRRASSIASRGSSPGPSEAVEGDVGDSTNDTEVAPLNSGRGSARTSIDSQGKPRSPVASFSPTFHSSHSSSNHHATQPHSVFVAHKSRSPFKPPSANPSIHGLAHRSAVSSHHGQSHSRRGSDNGSKQLPNAPATTSSSSAPAATWRRSWGRPPPTWVGTIDDRPSTEEIIAANKPKLRDVFAAKEGEDEWVDEDEEPTYSGGLGQLSSINASNNSTNQAPFGSSASDYNSNSRTGISDSPFSTKMSRNEASSIFGNRHIASSSSSGTASFNSNSAGLLSQGRYAGVRSLFQPPSLGREVTPKTLSISNNPVNSNSALPSSSLIPTVSSVPEGHEPKVPDGDPEPSALSASTSETSSSGGTSRRGAQPPAFKQITIEEEEEDE